MQSDASSELDTPPSYSLLAWCIYVILVHIHRDLNITEFLSYRKAHRQEVITTLSRLNWPCTQSLNISNGIQMADLSNWTPHNLIQSAQCPINKHISYSNANACYIMTMNICIPGRSSCKCRCLSDRWCSLELPWAQESSSGQWKYS